MKKTCDHRNIISGFDNITVSDNHCVVVKLRQHLALKDFESEPFVILANSLSLNTVSVGDHASISEELVNDLTVSPLRFG